MIPILDWQRFASGSDREGFVADLGQAGRETGFFLLKGHGVDPRLVDGVFTQVDAFLALPDDIKRRLDIRLSPHNRGWAASGSEALDEKSGLMDQKEAYNVGWALADDDPRVLAGEPFRGVNVWPDLPGFRETMLAYYRAALDLGVALHAAFEIELGLPEGFFPPFFTESMSTLRVLRSPPSEGGIGAGAHSDYGSVALLMTDGVRGLQAQPRGGDWMDVLHVPGAYVVNIGDCLMRWSNDLYISTPHRVLPPKALRRSIAFFLDPNRDAVIEALPGTGEAKYPSISGADYLRSRPDATYAPM